jgi:hypothetical protein
MAHENAEKLRFAYEAFARGDVVGALRDMSEDCVWHSLGHGPLAGDYLGKDAITDFLARFVQITAGTARFEIVSILADEDWACLITQATATVEDQPMTGLDVHVYRLCDGQVTEGWFYVQDQLAADNLMMMAQAHLATAS